VISIHRTDNYQIQIVSFYQFAPRNRSLSPELLTKRCRLIRAVARNRYQMRSPISLNCLGPQLSSKTSTYNSHPNWRINGKTRASISISHGIVDFRLKFIEELLKICDARLYGSLAQTLSWYLVVPKFDRRVENPRLDAI
jgi:hypothetical protein